MPTKTIARRTMKALIMFALAINTATATLRAVEIIAHRGASFDAPENSLSAMKLAWQQGADAIETDIHLSKDGQIIVLHDTTTKRTAGVENKVEELTAAEATKLDIGTWKNPKFKGEMLPSIKAIFATIPEGKVIYTEIKSHNPAILEPLGTAMAASARKPDQLRIITFSYEMAKEAKARFPKHPVLWLHDWKENPETKQFPDIDELIEKARAAKLDGLDLNHRFPIDKAFVAKVHKAGLKLCTWTVDDAAIAKQELDAGVDGITTNRPEWLRKELAR